MPVEKAGSVIIDAMSNNAAVLISDFIGFII
jgi:hypothetical protein